MILVEFILKWPTENQIIGVEKQALCTSRVISSFSKVTCEINLLEGAHPAIILLKHYIPTFILLFQIKVIKVGAFSSLNIPVFEAFKFFLNYLIRSISFKNCHRSSEFSCLSKNNLQQICCICSMLVINIINTISKGAGLLL